MNNYIAISAVFFVILIEFFRVAHWQKELTHIILGVFMAAIVGFQVIGRNAYIIIRENTNN